MKTSVYDFFAETVLRFGEKTAVIDGEHSWTFNQLERSVNRLADALIPARAAPNAVVAVLLKKSYQAVVADLAVTAAGCVYMNLDVRSPAARIEQILTVIKPSLLITDTHGVSLLNQIESVTAQVMNLDEISQDIESLRGASCNPGESHFATIINTDPYCIINTSGSTGVPKGVVLNHRSFFDFIEWSEEALGIDGEEIIGSLSPVIFDIFSFELCMLACKGSTLCLIDERLSPYPAKILEILEKNRVSFIFWVPTIMVNIANLGLLEKFGLSDLKMVWFAGEVFPTVHFNKWSEHLPNARFVNLYGPIEITLDCTYYEVRDRLPDDQPLPIGHACRNTALLILNKNGTETKDGEIGELYVRGTSLAMGYYNNHEQTAQAFVQNPLNKSYPELIYKTGDLVMRKDGLYYFKGRADTMIKHMGYRIELADIEHTILAALPMVINVCVVYVSDRKEIIAYCELREPLSVASFRASLSQKLPTYMIPAKMVEVEQMPMNANGKIDRLHFKSFIEE